MTPSRRPGPVVVATACTLAALLLGYTWGHARGKAAQASEGHEAEGAVAPVKVAAMEQGKLEGRLAALGTIVAAPGASQTLAVAYECRVISILVSEGQAVASGTPLASVTDSPDALLSLQQARIDATAAQAQLTQTQSRYDLKLADHAL